tara:strand:- start:1461 stop:2234 length:774 start_codon:yes stop_codon:yes gene_type:complete
MKITDKINNSRYTLKKILSDEWDTTVISDYSPLEISKIYNDPNISNPYIKSYLSGFVCNIKLQHRVISNYNLHIIYYNFPESSLNASKQKVTKSIADKIKKLYENEYLNTNDSIMVIINEPVSESIQKYIDNLNIEFQNDLEINGLNSDISDEFVKQGLTLNKEYNLKHFKNVHIIDIDSLTNNLLEHKLVPKHTPIRNKEEINKILNDCNANISQLPIILKNDIISKLIRLSPGDICEIKRIDGKCGEYNFYRVCK